MTKEKPAGMAKVIVMHPTNIQLSVGKVPHREIVEIPTGEYTDICKGDEAAGRQPRLVRVDGK